MRKNNIKYIYSFGGGIAEGNEKMKDLLGGKGANLAEMAGHPNLQLPIPLGFTISTEVCNFYYQNKKKYPKSLKKNVDVELLKVEKLVGRKFGDNKNPLLVSVRSGARRSMPGMMETILNVGLTTKTITGIIKQTGNERFVYDAYRRLIMMYSDVVMEKAAGIEPKGLGIRKELDLIIDEIKNKRKIIKDTDLNILDLKNICEIFKKKILEVFGKPFPDNHKEQLWGSIGAVFSSWNGKRAVSYRRIEGIPDDWGTAVTVQSMVFGNMGNDSATGVAFTRNPNNGENKFFGEYLINAQGEDVVAGIRTPLPINLYSNSSHKKLTHSLENEMPVLYKELYKIQNRLEKHYRDMQDIEFTIEDGKLYLLQCRIGKRNGIAAVRMAIEMYKEKLISKDEAIMRVTPAQLDELLHPRINPIMEKQIHPIAKGLPAGPGGAVGMIVFSADDAEKWASDGKKVILVREETSPEDVHGMHSAEAILTAKGGMTSHAALVARGWGKCCIVGCSKIHIDYKNKLFTTHSGKIFKEGDWLTLNGSKGNIYAGELPLIEPDLFRNKYFKEFMKICDDVRLLKIRTNADSPEDASIARKLGAEGIGLCRTEHMFFNPDRIKLMRKMIIADKYEDRVLALNELLPYQQSDFEGIFKVMNNLPVTIRLLDPPLNEFLPKEELKKIELAEELGIHISLLEKRIKQLSEANPMLGHRGCRLGITYPEITEMQSRAIFQAAIKIAKQGIKVFPEVMIPLVGDKNEVKHQFEIIERIAKEVIGKSKIKLKYLIGTMIELPRAVLVADKIAEWAQFFSYGTNDLTQMAYGFSRDDIGSFLPGYFEQKIFTQDPFHNLDQNGVGELVKIGIQKGRSVKPDLKIGICGEHGGDPSSIEFFHKVGMNYVSCSPFRVPIARLASAQAVVKSKN